MNLLKKNNGSYRDPAGEVYYHQNRIIRAIKKNGKKRYEFLKEKNLIELSIKNNFLVDSKEINNKTENFEVEDAEYYLEHKKIEYISYPYEWGFCQLKDAALHHLNFQIFLLKNDAVLIDASAYNIQFQNNKPIFIDLLSIDEYKNGDYWIGYHQFLKEFLNPLLLSSIKDIPFNNWYKGNLNGIYTEELNSILSFKDKISLNIILHVVLLSKASKKLISNPKDVMEKFKNKKYLSKNSYMSILLQLKKWIQRLSPKIKKTTWEDYSVKNTYNINQKEIKRNILKEFIKKIKAKNILDLGCNEGFYSIESLDSGCNSSVGVDFDINSINKAYNFSKNLNKPFLPLFMDCMNPSSNLGWFEKERYSFIQRANFDAVVAFAFEHHLTIANNVPLKEAIDWILKFGKKGLIEFVSKEDTTIQKMLSLKGDIFLDYDRNNFESLLIQKANIIKDHKITSTRNIYEFEIK